MPVKIQGVNSIAPNTLFFSVNIVGSSNDIYSFTNSATLVNVGTVEIEAPPIIIFTGINNGASKYVSLQMLYINGSTNQIKTALINFIDKKDDGKTTKKGSVYTDNIHDDNTNINKVEYNQFTDFAGFENDKPNGRLQTELRCKWGISKKWYGKEDKWQVQFVRSVIFPDVLLNRIDKSQKEETYNYPAYLNSSFNPDSSTPTFTTTGIWKYSNLHIGTRIILIALKKDNFRFHLQAGAGLVRNRPFVDTLVSQSGKTDSSIFRPTYSMAYNVELFGKTLFIEKTSLNLDFNVGIMWLYLHDSYYKQYDAAVVDPYNKASVLLPVDYPAKKVRPVYMVSFKLTKNIGTAVDHYAYLRGSWMYQTGEYFPVYKRTINTGEVIYQKSNAATRFYNNFLQIQVGISLDLNDLLKPGGDRDDKKGKGSSISDTAG